MCVLAGVRANSSAASAAFTTTALLRLALLAMAGASARAKLFAAQNAGQDMLKLTRWAVVGDVLNPAKPAARVVAALQGAGKQVHLVNPRAPSLHATLKDAAAEAGGEGIEAVDLCINSVAGLKMVEECEALGIKNVFIQPGAESAAILKLCEEQGINVFQGCVMVELGVDH